MIQYQIVTERQTDRQTDNRQTPCSSRDRDVLSIELRCKSACKHKAIPYDITVCNRLQIVTYMLNLCICISSQCKVAFIARQHNSTWSLQALSPHNSSDSSVQLSCVHRVTTAAANDIYWQVPTNMAGIRRDWLTNQNTDCCFVLIGLVHNNPTVL